MGRIRLTEKMASSRSITARLDQIASELEPTKPQIALAIDHISDSLEGRIALFGIGGPKIKNAQEAMKAFKDAGIHGTITNEGFSANTVSPLIDVQKVIKQVDDSADFSGQLSLSIPT